MATNSNDVLHLAASSPATMSVAEATGSYIWEVEDEKQVSDFLSADNGQRLKSLPFSIGKLQWILEAFPNGDRKDNIGSFMVYLTLIQLPKEWQRVTFLLRLFNAQTCSSFTGIATYTKTSNSGGWSDGTLLLDDLKSAIRCSAEDSNKDKSKAQKMRISLGCRINILQLIATENGSKIYQHPLKPQYISLMKSASPILHLEWVIDEAMLQKLKTANVGKKFESEIFYDSWSLRCAPNGKREHDANNVKLYLLLCALPPNIVHCKVRYTLSCKEANVEWVNTRDFSYIYPNVGWPNGTMMSADLKPGGKYQHLTQLTFAAKIEILKLYDNDILSDDDDDDDEDDEEEEEEEEDESSSYDSNDTQQTVKKNDTAAEDRDSDEKNEDDQLGDIQGRDQLMQQARHRSVSLKSDKSAKSRSRKSPQHRARRKSNAKRSEIKRRQSQEMVFSPPTGPPMSTGGRRYRQETDMNVVRDFMLSQSNQSNQIMMNNKTNSSISSPKYTRSPPGMLGGAAAYNGDHNIVGGGVVSPKQYRQREVTDIGAVQQYIDAASPTSAGSERMRSATMMERGSGTSQRQRPNLKPARSSDLGRRRRRNDTNNSYMLEYDTRLSLLESNVKILSLQISEIAQTLKSVAISVNEQSQTERDEEKNESKHVQSKKTRNKMEPELYHILNSLRSDMSLIKRKVLEKGSSKSSSESSKKAEKVNKWLSNNVGLPQYLDMFLDNGLDDLDIIKDLNDDELYNIGVTKFGHRKKILKCIESLLYVE